jgi:excisionase family DNA binding protein
MNAASVKEGTMGETPEVMDIRQASQYLGVSRETLYKYLTQALVPAFKLGNRWKFKKTVLDNWMERESSEHTFPARRKRLTAEH